MRPQVGNTEAIARAVLDHALDVGCVWKARSCMPHWRCACGGRTRWWSGEPGSATRALSEQALTLSPPPAGLLELDQAEAVKQAVAAGLGIACLPRTAVDDAVAAGPLVILSTPFLALQRTLSVLLAPRALSRRIARGVSGGRARGLMPRWKGAGRVRPWAQMRTGRP